MSEETTEVSVVLEFNPEIFDPKKEALLAIAEEVSKITADPAKMTKEDLELINTTKNKLVKARTSISKAGKAARDAATKYNRSVKAYEDELIAILEPEELRLKKLETDAKEYATKQERLKVLPDYKQQLASIGDLVEVTDDELLGMDPTAFQAYYNTRLGAHLQLRKAEADAKEEADRIAKAAEQKKIDDANAEIEREKNRLALEKYNGRVQRLLTLGFRQAGNNFFFGKEGQTADLAIDDANVKLLEDEGFNELHNKVADDIVVIKARWADEAKKAEDARVAAAEAKAKEEAEAKAKLEADEKEAKRLADEAAEKARLKEEEEQAAREKAEREAELEFQKWLSENSYNEATDTLIEDVDEEGGLTILYRTVSIYRQK